MQPTGNLAASKKQEQGGTMTYFKSLAIAAIAVGLLSAGSLAPAQVSVGIGIGVAPVCPYGYFDYPPYDCAPYGYYGPDWFTGGVFIGAGPWFHGPRGFYGHVDNRYDPRNGYRHRCLSAVRGHSPTFRETKRVTAKAMPGMPVTTRGANIAPDSPEADALGEAGADVGDKGRFDRNQRPAYRPAGLLRECPPTHLWSDS